MARGAVSALRILVQVPLVKNYNFASKGDIPASLVRLLVAARLLSIDRYVHDDFGDTTVQCLCC